MLFSDFCSKYIGTSADYDNAFGVQCVDLIKLYIDKVFNVKPQSIGNAIDYYKNYNNSYIKTIFSKIDITKKNRANFLYYAGDIVVFESSSKNGHIAICAGTSGKNFVNCYDQNYKGTHSGMTLHKLYYDYYKPVCVLRSKYELYKNVNIFVFKQNATILKNCSVHSNVNYNYTNPIITGNVFEGERVKLLSKGSENAIIQYYTKYCSEYKVGIIPVTFLKID